MELFNQAFLAKTGRRILKNPDLLVSRVLKKLYFKDCYFLKAKCGANASFLWRSIIWGKEILDNVCIWRVGSGDKIKVFDEYWVFSRNEAGFSNPPYLPNDVVVSDLRLASGDRNKDFLDKLFDPADVERILAIPVGSLDNNDEIIWRHNKNGNYSVRSGYQVALTTLDIAESSNNEENKRWWSKFWHLNIPPKIKMFGWRLCMNWLPTFYNLAKKGVKVDSICPRCGLAPELTTHCL